MYLNKMNVIINRVNFLKKIFKMFHVKLVVLLVSEIKIICDRRQLVTSGIGTFMYF